MHAAFTQDNKKLISIFPTTTDQLPQWIAMQSKQVQQWISSSLFSAESGAFCLIPNIDGTLQSVLVGVQHADDYLAFGALPAKLPQGFYQFSKYKAEQPRVAKLFLPKSIDEKALTICLDAIYLSRDLINTPAEDMGPDQLENAVKTISKKFSAKINVIKGDKLIVENYPAIHAVGRASVREPRVIDLRWSSKNTKKNAPKITLVGKGESGRASC